MFSIIPANRPCITNFINISPTQFAFSFPSHPPFSHLVVFILPGSTLPPGTAAGVHIQLPGSSEFRFLGAIADEKPSAVFRVNLPGKGPPTGGASSGNGDVDAMTDSPSVSAPPTLSTPTSQPPLDVREINLGISVEPVANVQAQLAALQSQSRTESQSPTFPGTASSAMVLHQPPPPTKVLAQRIIKDAFNFLASFAGDKGAGTAAQEVVPLKSFQDWWTKFETRVENDPGFLEREEGD